jgi:hypothetical protein
VVNHYLLKAKLFNVDTNPSWWKVIDDLYSGSTEYIRWNGEGSRRYQVEQGVKQGSLISPHLYKLYINDLLIDIEGSGLGTNIGSIFTGCPTCADDVTLLANDIHQVQPLLDAAKNYADTHGYQLHPNKTTITALVKPTSRAPTEKLTWTLGDSTVTTTKEFVHLGLTWKEGRRKPDVCVNIQKARRSAYALLKVGLHGVNGLDPPAAIKIIHTYVTPALLHGLESAILTREDMDKIDSFYKKMLRQVQSLPNNTATEAIYILSGNIPAEGLLHQRALTLYGSICRLPEGHNIKQLARRQLAISNNKHSWFTMICRVGEKYGLDIWSNMRLPRDKQNWKREVRLAVRSYWQKKLIEDAAERSTLKWLIANIDMDSPHPLWLPCVGEPRLVEAAATRARMLVGRYMTRAQMTKFNLSNDSSCKLCHAEEEDLLHMLVMCPALEEHASSKRDAIKSAYEREKLKPPQTHTELCSAILNGDCYIRTARRGDGRGASFVKLEDPSNKTSTNLLCNLLCAKLAKERESLLDDCDL